MQLKMQTPHTRASVQYKLVCHYFLSTIESRCLTQLFLMICKVKTYPHTQNLVNPQIITCTNIIQHKCMCLCVCMWSLILRSMNNPLKRKWNESFLHKTLKNEMNERINEKYSESRICFHEYSVILTHKILNTTTTTTRNEIYANNFISDWYRIFFFFLFFSLYAAVKTGILHTNKIFFWMHREKNISKILQ